MNFTTEYKRSLFHLRHFSSSSCFIKNALMDSFDQIDLKINQNFSCILSGVSNCGKTFKAIEFLLRANEIVSQPISKVVIYCNNYQEIYEKLRTKYEIVFVNSVSEAEKNLEENCCLLIDDKLCELEKNGALNTFVTELFVRNVHHNKINVLLLLQSLFSKNLRTIFNNATYLLIGKFIKDRANIVHFGKQFCPHNPRYMQESYELATRNPFGFLFVDLNVLSNDKYRLRNSMFPSDANFEIYVSKK